MTHDEYLVRAAAHRRAKRTPPKDPEKLDVYTPWHQTESHGHGNAHSMAGGIHAFGYLAGVRAALAAMHARIGWVSGGEV